MHFQPKLYLLIFILSSCSIPPNESEAPNEPPTLVDTSSRPTVKQWKGIWAFQDSTVFLLKRLEGARLNGIIEEAENQFVALITAENYPINPSPW